MVEKIHRNYVNAKQVDIIRFHSQLLRFSEVVTQKAEQKDAVPQNRVCRHMPPPCLVLEGLFCDTVSPDTSVDAWHKTRFYQPTHPSPLYLPIDPTSMHYYPRFAPLLCCSNWIRALCWFPLVRPRTLLSLRHCETMEVLIERSSEPFNASGNLRYSLSDVYIRCHLISCIYIMNES